jgi:hypothetical protein
MSIRRIKLRRDSTQNWEGSDPVLHQGEIGVELLTAGNRIKVGDGFKNWSELEYVDDVGLESIRQEYGDDESFRVGYELTS